jgi:hypothetical protein
MVDEESDAKPRSRIRAEQPFAYFCYRRDDLASIDALRPNSARRKSGFGPYIAGCLMLLAPFGSDAAVQPSATPPPPSSPVATLIQ